jgi:phage tail-like protein
VGTIETDRELLARYVNGAGGWLGLQTAGVELGPVGELRLQSIPDAGVVAPVSVASAAGPAPAGCSLDEGGTGFVSEPDTGRVLIVTRCAPASDEAPDVVGRRQSDTELLPGAFVTPRGLLLGPRHRLYVADAGADVVLVIELRTGTTTGRWNAVEPWCLGGSGPWVYVLDRGGPNVTGRVRRLDADGVEDAEFAALAAGALTDPVRLAAVDDRLFVVDRRADHDAVVPFVIGSAGAAALDAGSQAAWAHPVREHADDEAVDTGQAVTRVSSVGGGDGRVYLVDGARHDVLTYSATGGFIGSTSPRRPVASLWLAGRVLWSLPVAPGVVLRHAVDGSRLRTGVFVCGPLPTATEHGRREIRVRFDRSDGSHLQLWTGVTSDAVPPSPWTLRAPSGSIWSPVPPDVEVALVDGPVGPQLFVGGQLGGNGTSSPSVHQIGISGSRGWIEQLPAIYRKDPAQSDFLDRFLRLLRSVQAETAEEAADLVRRFDAWTADDPPRRPGADRPLDALAGWLRVHLDERWKEARRRGVVAQAFDAQAVRGTPAGLRTAITCRLAVDVTIDEPAQRASIWSLESTASDGTCTWNAMPVGLGFDTMLVAGPPEGAVLGASAVVGQSSVTAGTDVGAPLFEDLAHRFHVSAKAVDVERVGGEAALRAVIDAEKPAHTVYTVCLHRAQARVEFQARVGIDAIVAGPPPAMDLDGPTPLDDGVLIGPGPRGDEPSLALVGDVRLGQIRLS